ncbi:MAG: DNA-binding protein WhiA [Oscillospiraceae bacterium]
MSFSTDVKAELCRTELGARPAAAAECYGILLFCNTFTAREIRIITSSDEFAARLPRLFGRAFGVSFDELPDAGESGKRAFVITDTEKIRKILEAFGYDPEGVLSHHVNLGILEEDAAREGFVRGAFLAGGSVTDPGKRYHLEFVTDHYMVSREITALFMDMGFEPKSVARGGNYIMYFKQSSVIEDLLTTIGAPISAMGVMSAKIEKDMTNSVNRKVNCDTANVAKTVEAASVQLAAIRNIRRHKAFDSLPEKLRETAVLREENPELALSELALSAVPPVTKSCLNHRLRKLIEISEKLNG